MEKNTKLDILDNNYKRAAINIAQRIIEDLENINFREDLMRVIEFAEHNYIELKKNYLKERNS